MKVEIIASLLFTSVFASSGIPPRLPRTRTQSSAGSVSEFPSSNPSHLPRPRNHPPVPETYSSISPRVPRPRNHPHVPETYSSIPPRVPRPRPQFPVSVPEAISSSASFGSQDTSTDTSVPTKSPRTPNIRLDFMLKRSKNPKGILSILVKNPDRLQSCTEALASLRKEYSNVVELGRHLIKPVVEFFGSSDSQGHEDDLRSVFAATFDTGDLLYMAHFLESNNTDLRERQLANLRLIVTPLLIGKLGAYHRENIETPNGRNIFFASYFYRQCALLNVPRDALRECLEDDRVNSSFSTGLATLCPEYKAFLLS